jgi:hypothetical protein
MSVGPEVQLLDGQGNDEAGATILHAPAMGSDTADQGGAGNDEGERHAAEQRAAGRLGFRGSIHGGYLIGE